ncbi:hypothetical protein N7488_004747 [Penicillium malachiteum]|nr:hypothetical protein N7488_004747 [Penicillium malachiteum]
MEETKSRLRSPVLLEERDYPESFGQVEAPTETQSELIGRIGNKKLASRLNKRTLKIFKREERLNAIEFYRRHVHINPQTGEESNLTIASAAEALHLESAMPIRIELEYDNPFEGAPTHWAIKLLLKTKAEILLPLSLCLRESLVGAVINTAPLVSFSGLEVQAFQLVSLSQFSFVPQVSERAIVSQFFRHLEDSGTDSGGGFKLEYIEETLKEDAHTTGGHEFRMKLVRALKLSAQKSLEWVNGEKRCLYYTCPERQEAPVSYYCRHHSESLINYAMTPAASMKPSVLYQEQKREINLTAQTLESLQHVKVLCYGGLKETTCQVKDKIIKVCGYKPDDINTLSWFAAQDMECFLKILTGSNFPIENKISHKDHANFK